MGRDAAAGDGGLLLRSSLGFGHSWTHAEATNAQPDLGMQAWAPALMISPGYEFFPGFAVHGDIFGSMHFAHRINPDEDAGGYQSADIGMLAFMLGAGVTYQPQPGSVFLNGGIGFSELWGSRWQLPGNGGPPSASTAASYPGYALNGSIGQLFEIHDRWSLGPSLNYAFMAVGRPEEDDLSFSRSHTLWLGLSALFHPVR